MKYDPDNLTQKQTLLLDNLYASLVTLVAMKVREEEGETKRSFEPYVDEAHKLIMTAKHRIHEITLSKEHNYF